MCGSADPPFRSTLRPTPMVTIGAAVGARRTRDPWQIATRGIALPIAATDEGWTERMRWKRIAAGAMAVPVAVWIATTAGVGSASTTNSGVPHYQHIVEIMMENTSYATIIGNSNAPQINALADRYGLATNYFGVTHP